MIRATLRRKAATWAVLLGCGLALVHCGTERLAGSSVTTGNPTEIQVGFTGENGPVTVAGRVEIYGTTQIPIAGFRTEPLARHNLAGKSTFTLNAGHFEGIADSLWPQGSLQGDSLAHFNLVVIGATQGAILRDMVFRLKEGKFTLKEGTWTAGIGGAVSMTADLTGLIEYKAFINPNTLEATRHNYLFLLGTGYAAKSDNGNFTFPSVPIGMHSLSFLTLPDKQFNTGNEDTAEVYGVNKPLVSGKIDTVQATRVDFKLPLPADYKH
jgi:hypothetical protein